MRCTYCRERDAELLTRWERLRYWLFFRLNHIFFPEDLEDLISQKYTQGYSDGNTDGFDRANSKRVYTSVKDLFHD